MHRDPTIAPALNLVQGAADGTYTLPAEILDAARVRSVMLDQSAALRREQAPASLDAMADDAANRVVEHITAGGSGVPDDLVDALMAAEEANRRSAYALDILQRTLPGLDDGLRQTIRGNRDRIIVEHLRPVLATIMKSVRAIAPKIASLDLSAANVDTLALRAPASVRTAYLELQDAQARYTRLRAARRHLIAVAGGPIQDSADEWSEIENLRSLWPTTAVWLARQQVGVARAVPWPTEPLARLVWLATSSAKVWMPTPEEQDRAYESSVADTKITRPFGSGAFGFPPSGT